jgi:hypothetical protein
MNWFPFDRDGDRPDRGERLPGAVLLGDAMGSMVAATVFGLTRAVNELGMDTGSANAVKDARALRTPAC